MWTSFLFYCSLLSTVFAQTECETGKCYNSVQDHLKNLSEILEKLNGTALNATIPKGLDDSKLRHLLQRLENLEKQTAKSIRSLDPLNKKTVELHKILNDNGDELEKFKTTLNEVNIVTTSNLDLDNNLKELQDIYKRMNSTVSLYNHTVDQCKESEEEYGKLVNVTNDIDNDFKNAEASFQDVQNKIENLNKKINESYMETLKAKKILDELEMPDFVIENFLDSIEPQLALIKQNKDILEELLKASSKHQMDDLWKKIEKIRQLIDDFEVDYKVINKGLQDYEKAIPTDRYESLGLSDEEIASMRKSMDQLMIRIKELYQNLIRIEQDLDNKSRKLLGILKKNVKSIKSRREALNKYRDIVKKGIKNSKTEIKKTEEYLNRLYNLQTLREKLKIERDDIKLIHDEMEKYTECPPRGVILEA